LDTSTPSVEKRKDVPYVQGSIIPEITFAQIVQSFKVNNALIPPSSAQTARKDTLQSQENVRFT